MFSFLSTPTSPATTSPVKRSRDQDITMDTQLSSLEQATQAVQVANKRPAMTRHQSRFMAPTDWDLSVDEISTDEDTPEERVIAASVLRENIATMHDPISWDLGMQEI